MVYEDGLGCAEEKLRKANPDLLAGAYTFGLDGGSDGLVGGVVAIRTMDPDNGDVFSLGGGGSHDDGVSVGNSSEGTSKSNGKKVSHVVLK